MKSFFFTLLFSLVLNSWISAAHHDCIHNKIKHDIKPMDTSALFNYDPSDGRMLQQEYESIRIYADFTNLHSGDDIFDEYIQNQLMPSALSYLEATLNVIRFTQPIVLPYGAPCGVIYPSPDLVSSGVEADLIILVTSEHNPSTNYIAYSSPCSISTFNNRPILGMLSFNTAYLSVSEPTDLQNNLYTAIHEITHVLGFSVDLYPYFVNPETNEPLTDTTGTIDLNGIQAPYINVEPLTTMVREYFGCPTAVGALLEDEGGQGSAGSHWERRVFFNEFMTANAIVDARVTNFTLALLESSGWYQVNYSMSEPFQWGQGQGCTFYDGPCMSMDAEPNFPEFCAPLTTQGCSFTSRAVAVCGSPTATTRDFSLPESLNYWGNFEQVIDPFSDNCPYFIGFSTSDCENPGAQGQASIPQEVFDSGSRCITGNLSPFGTVQTATSGYCFPVECIEKEDGTYNLNITVGNNEYQCTENGQTLTVPNTTGNLLCPDPNLFCFTSNPRYCRLGCSGRGECVNNTCVCPQGWTGSDCSLRTLTQNCTICADQENENACFGDFCWCNEGDANCQDPLFIGTRGTITGSSGTVPDLTTRDKSSYRIAALGVMMTVIIALFILN